VNDGRFPKIDANAAAGPSPEAAPCARADAPAGASPALPAMVFERVARGGSGGVAGAAGLRRSGALGAGSAFDARAPGDGRARSPEALPFTTTAAVERVRLAALGSFAVGMNSP
jgi:hypothetical protein